MDVKEVAISLSTSQGLELMLHLLCFSKQLKALAQSTAEAGAVHGAEIVQQRVWSFKVHLAGGTHAVVLHTDHSVGEIQYFSVF